MEVWQSRLQPKSQGVLEKRLEIPPLLSEAVASTQPTPKSFYFESPSQDTPTTSSKPRTPSKARSKAAPKAKTPSKASKEPKELKANYLPSKLATPKNRGSRSNGIQSAETSLGMGLNESKPSDAQTTPPKGVKRIRLKKQVG
ncbi:hypothetical protein CFIMG_008363RA00001 [Ceratocystis fimbriata CBS 114723]|uniref:Uncharacterized protein n=1 Tax=Ceratocystis fimbriata CBS 114723 TaxID=1035309 RepID=A0A2C5X316_9PEZI|nr:hypothetical protein CFIMG_008363RA00001 [Ceratocystis fimbriata CBS 114723]